MNADIDMTDEHEAIVRDILLRYLPVRSRVFVFGSREQGSARQYSGLDLAIDCGRPLGLALTSEMAEAFSESDLPYKVDIVDLATIEPGFSTRIMARAISFCF
jgi:type I restriction enzyme S subunit